MKQVLLQTIVLLSLMIFGACAPKTQPGASPDNPSFSSERDDKLKPFPAAPHLDITPGSLCKNPHRYKYEENIGICKRKKDTYRKKRVKRTYESLGYDIFAYGPGQFKVDHFIPLCAGGSDDIDNLWPQHKSIYEQTDDMEYQLCVQMEHGLMTQEEVIDAIIIIKMDPSKVDDIRDAITPI